MNQTVALAIHSAVLLALVIVGAVIHNGDLIAAGLAYGAGVGANAAIPTRSQS